MFAIDGANLPSNGSSNAWKHRSGTRTDFERQATKLEATAHQIVARHRATDALPSEPGLVEKEAKQIARLEHDAAQIRTWLATHPDERCGVTGKGGTRKRNRTDNESAEMATGKGVIHGYTGVAAVDAAHQIVVDAQAHGAGSERALSRSSEQELLLPVVTAIAPLLTSTSLVTADAGYHSDANLKTLDARGIDALIAEKEMRRAMPASRRRPATRPDPDPLHDKTLVPALVPADETSHIYRASDFVYDAEAWTCVCPAGKRMNPIPPG
jgi:DDE family transposase